MKNIKDQHRHQGTLSQSVVILDVHPTLTHLMRQTGRHQISGCDKKRTKPNGCDRQADITRIYMTGRQGKSILNITESR